MRLRDWPGIGGPLVHVPDPFSASDDIVEALGARFGPGYRVVSVDSRPGHPYQVQAADVFSILEQFGFLAPVLVGERLGCVAALLVAAWHPGHVSRLVLIDPMHTAPLAYATSLEARALRDCPPDWPSLRNAVQCPILEVRWNDAADEKDLQTFLRLT